MGPCTTVKPERTGAGRWMSIAAMVEERLNIIAQQGGLSEGDIPKGVLASAMRFISRAQVAEVSGWQSSGDRAAAYIIAREAFACIDVPRKEERLWFVRATAFLGSAEQARPLIREEIAFARTLARFFGHIKQQGAIEYSGLGASDDDE